MALARVCQDDDRGPECQGGVFAIRLGVDGRCSGEKKPRNKAFISTMQHYVIYGNECSSFGP